jgi:hypothetical protein
MIFMEVHHHSHTARRKWTHYFWEFLMLFLAVFCGFLAKIQVEHKIEKVREKQFISSFILDLKQDIIAINANTELRNSKIIILDLLIKLLSSANPNHDGASAYYFGRRVTRSTNFQSNDQTIKQLKNAGGLRLIRNQMASNAIMDYDQAIDCINYLQYSREIQELNEIYPLLAKLYDGMVLEMMIHGMDIIRRQGNPSLRTTDKNVISDLIYFLQQYKSTSVVGIVRLQTVKKKAIEPLQFLQKEYHLK